MRIKIAGYNPDEERKPVNLDECMIDLWFTPGGVRWTCCLKDKDGNQVGEAQFAYHKADFKNIKKTDFKID